MDIKVSKTKGTKNVSTRFLGKPLCIKMSRAAQHALENIEGSLWVEMELQFGCLIRKRVRFYESDEDMCFQPVTDDVGIAFSPVFSHGCSIGNDACPPAGDVEIKRKEAFIPRWLCIHHRKGNWEGTFGY